MEKYIKLIFNDTFGENLCRLIDTPEGSFMELVTTKERLKEAIKNYLEK